MAAPTFVALGTASSGQSSVTPGLPSGTQADDILLCYVQTSNQNTAGVPTATNLTFVEVANSPQGTGTPATAGAVGLRVYWARRTASAPGTITVPDSGNHTVAQVAAYRGCIATGNPWDVTTGTTTGNTGAQFNFPNLTTTVNDCRVVFVGGNPSDSATDQFDSTHFTFSSNPNTTSNTARNTAGDGSNVTTQTGGGVQSFDGILATAGNTGAFSLFTTNTNVNSAMIIIALRPASGVQQVSFTATFSTSGSLIKSTNRLLAATLAPSATLAKASARALTATLSFTGAIAVSKLFLRAFTATLNFTGAISRRTGKALSATLSLAAALMRRITHSFAATLSLVGAVAKRIPKAFTGTLSFVGAITASKFFTRAFTATLNASATLSRKTLKALAGTLSFAGSIARSIRKSLAATISFIGDLATTYVPGGGHLFFQSFTATLNASATFSRNARKVFSAVLTPSGALTRRTAKAAFSATLSFVGLVGKTFPRAFAATLAFTGNLVRSRLILKVFTATLNMTGAIRRSVGKLFAATMAPSADVSKSVAKAFTATLSFIGFFFKGGAITIWAGVKAGANLLFRLAGSSASIKRAGSQLDIDKTE